MEPPGIRANFRDVCVIQMQAMLPKSLLLMCTPNCPKSPRHISHPVTTRGAFLPPPLTLDPQVSLLTAQ